jgi:hypothetical protein
MISSLRPEVPETDPNPRALTPNQRLNLRILTALATLFVRQHEIVAVVTKDSFGGDTLELVTCPQSNNQVLAMPNPRKDQKNLPEFESDALTFRKDKLAVLTPMVKDADLKDLAEYAFGCWWVINSFELWLLWYFTIGKRNHFKTMWG